MTHGTDKDQKYELISDDAYIYRYGMTVKEIREKIKYKLGEVKVMFKMEDRNAVHMSGSSSQPLEEEMEEELSDVDDEEWTYTPFGNSHVYLPDDDWSSLGPSNPGDVQGTGHLPDWDDSQIGEEYQPSWFQKEETLPEKVCEHTRTRQVELIFTTATECIDCGHRLK